MPTTEGQLPLEENRRIFREQIAPVFLDGCTPQSAPIVVIVAGQTGAGKTAVTRMVKDALDLNGPAAWINMDFYNPHHPQYASWQAERPQEADALVRPDGDLWWEQAQEYALARGFSILLESAMVSPAEYEDICRRVQGAALPPAVAPYRIETAFVAVPGPISRFGIMGRYLDELQERGHGRLVDPDIHDAALRGVLRGAAALEREGLGDYAAVLRRDGHTVHAQTITAGQSTPEDQLTLVTAIEREHARVQSPAEAAQFVARHAAATVMAPAFALPGLDYIARAAAPLLPPPSTPWREAAARAVQLRGVFPAADPDLTLVARTDADVVQFLAHALAAHHTALGAESVQAGTQHEATVERLLGELARRASLSPDQREREQQQRHALRTADHRTVSEAGVALPARPSAVAARSRSTTTLRASGSIAPVPRPATAPRPADGPEHRRGHGR
ncbi:zeta toxin family protein [Streptomyces sp. NBC_01314]|uniref:zeta toxin family protein n=1 Tax=Streptomyces sp. NBC_01314 TaxID=2903821 RepID=UPI0030861005|nr:zeta toxin family protein [Streptomyces sp. NBC_01314]